MKRPLQTMMLIVMVTVVLSVGWGGTLSSEQRARLHPEFQALLAEKFPNLGLLRGDMHDVARNTATDGIEHYHAVIHVTDPDLVRSAGISVNSVWNDFVTASLTADEILRLAQLEGVTWIDPGTINYPANDISVPETGASLLQGGFIQGIPYTGQGAIVLIYDSGIDWKHLDFRSRSDTTKSRILSLWDQTLTAIAGESHPSGFSYGVEYTNAQINAELGSSPPGLVRERDSNGHGTHVAGTAAGNGGSFGGSFSGMAPDADIVVVKGGNGSFYSTNMIDGLTYANNIATSAGKPIVVNWSIGGQSGPHDGTMDYEVATDQFTSNPGRVVAIAAGNDGANPIHTSGSAGSLTTITFTVPSYTPNSGTGNDQFGFDLWFQGNPTVTATLTSPNGHTASAANGATGTGNSTADGSMTVSNSASFTANGHRWIRLTVTDLGGTPPAVGSWTLTVVNAGVAISYDGWLWSRAVGSVAVSLNGGDVNSTVSSPGTSGGAITAAAYETRWTWPNYFNLQYHYTESDRTGNICSFSGFGPTRDGRLKPDIAAPGQGIASSLSSMADTTGQYSWILPDQKHFIDQGTSMATPHITGASALILGAFPGTSASEIKTLMTSTAIADAYATGLPNYSWGYGKLDILQAFARKASQTAVVTRTVLANDGTGATSFVTLTGTTKFAVKFSPTQAGKISGLFLAIQSTGSTRPVSGSGNLVCEVYSDNGGKPGTKLGSTVTFPIQRLTATGLSNYVQLLGTGVSAAPGTPFHLVVGLDNPSDAILVRIESVLSGTTSSTFNGSTWTSVKSNYRIRALVATATGVNAVLSGGQSVPLMYVLGQNYPNPFNPSTKISYNIGDPGNVRLQVFDILGREVASLVNERQAAGSYSVTWDGRDMRNIAVTSGVYFYRLESGAYTKTNKMVLVK